MNDADVRRKQMWDDYGRPVSVDTKAALRLLGITDVDPRDVAAFRYRDREAADAYAAANLEHWGHSTIGSYDLGEHGVVGVLDLRAAIAEMEERLKQERARHQTEPEETP